MISAVEKYLEKRAHLNRHKVEFLSTPTHLEMAIVIPALAEERTLPKTLQSLAACDSTRLDVTLVVVVVNNRSSEHVDPEAIQENQRTLEWLRSDPYAALHLAAIDASSPGLELSRKEGVGSARKIGMDHAVDLLRKSDAKHPLIVSLDADTAVEPNYLDALSAFARIDDSWGAVIDYAHEIFGDEEEHAAIISYELFLRYQELGLGYAGSPYAFHTIGSTIACTPEAYAAVSGMNRRKAGEDFYFLQQLAKTGSVKRITETTVHPSSRGSWRVPFGTGKRVNRFLDKTHEEYRVYHPDSYRVLKDWFELVEANPDAEGDWLLEKTRGIHEELVVFLEAQDFADKWAKLQSNASSTGQICAQFHCLFDAFQTLKLIHHLRDTALPEQETFDAYRVLPHVLLKRSGLKVELPEDVPDSLSSQLGFLEHLRKAMKANLV